MTVDLDQLREAMNDWDMDQAVSVHPVFAAGVAVLDAPTVWWCAEAVTTTREGYPMNAQDQPAWCLAHSHEGCGWVALVSVGENGEG